MCRDRQETEVGIENSEEEEDHVVQSINEDIYVDWRLSIKPGGNADCQPSKDRPVTLAGIHERMHGQNLTKR